MNGLWGMARGAAALAFAGLIGLCAALVLGALGASLWPKIDVFTHLTPLYGLGAVVGGAGALALRMNWRIPALAGFAILGAGALMAPELTAAAGQALAPRPPAEAPQLKLVSINLWRANAQIDRVEDFIRDESPDIIVLQEAQGAIWSDLPQRLADQYAHMAYCMREYWCDTIILSRLEFVEDLTPDNYHIAAARMALPERLGGGVIDVVGVHMPWPWPHWQQTDEFPRVAELARQLDPQRAIIAGDFNATPWSNNLHWLDEQIVFPRLTHAMASWPTPARTFTRFRQRLPLAFMPIDHVYAGLNWRVVEVRRGAHVGSDHYPLVAVLTPAAMPAPALRGSSPDELEAGP